MQWLNEPKNWTQHGNNLTITTDPQTDFWRITHYGFTFDNGHFYYQTVMGDFVAEVKFTGAYQALYDQAGLMVRLDEQHWVKCGVEFVEGMQNASVVVTREFSDWSVAPLASNPPSLWMRVKRAGDALEIFSSLDGSSYTLMRVAYFPTTPQVQVGVMCCSPKGDGFSVTFEGFEVS
jgi:uncharacterized protein